MFRLRITLKKIVQKINNKILLMGIKDAKDESGRYIKIQGRGHSIILHDIDKNFIISSESDGAGNGFILYRRSIKNFEDYSVIISDEKKMEVVMKFKTLLEKAGFNVFVMD